MSTSYTHINIDSLRPKEFSEEIISYEQNKQTSFDLPEISDAQSYTIEVSPVLPIKARGNKLYDNITSYINQLGTISYNFNSYIEHYNNCLEDAKRNNNTTLFNYSNSIYSYNVTSYENYSYIDNNVLMKYEDIVCETENGNKYISLDENTSIDDYIISIKKSGDVSSSMNFNKKSDFNGAFLYPQLDSISQILTNGGERANVVIKPNESISIPITFEFFISDDTESKPNISKELIFCLKDSVLSTGRYFELKVIGNKNSNFADSIYSSVDNYTLEDSLTSN